MSIPSCRRSIAPMRRIPGVDDAVVGTAERHLAQSEGVDAAAVLRARSFCGIRRLNGVALGERDLAGSP